MSRHNRAQTTPTHASGVHLFTVAMIGHAKYKGAQLPQHVTVARIVNVYGCLEGESLRVDEFLGAMVFEEVEVVR